MTSNFPIGRLKPLVIKTSLLPAAARLVKVGEKMILSKEIKRNCSSRIRGGGKVKCAAWGLHWWVRQLPGLLRGALRPSHLWRLRRLLWASASASADGSLQRWVTPYGGDHFLTNTYLGWVGVQRNESLDIGEQGYLGMWVRFVIW